MKKTPTFLVLLLTACASSSGVVPMGSETFMVSRSEKGFDTTGSRVKADALKEANTYCSGRGKALELVNTSEKDMVPFKSDAQAEVVFKCVAGK
jgi:hypothetical protein